MVRPAQRVVGRKAAVMAETTDTHWVNEREPFPAYLRTLSGCELAVMQHDARQCGDSVTVQAVLAELRRRSKRT